MKRFPLTILSTKSIIGDDAAAKASAKFVMPVLFGKGVKEGSAPEAGSDPNPPLAVLPAPVELITPKVIAAVSADAKVQNLLVQNPSMNAPTFFNLLKSRGIKFTEATKKFFFHSIKGKEADSASSSVGVAVTRSRESFVVGVNYSNLSLKFIEGAAKDNGIGPTRFRVVLISEGMGNARDCFYYTREALESAIPVFQGKKCYANHPSSTEENTRPERDVRDIIGYFENLMVSNDETGRAQLVGDLVLLSGMAASWARDQIATAIEFSKKFPDKDFIGLSINANGDASPMPIMDLLQRGVPDNARLKLEDALRDGITQVKMVNRISDATSCDLVTEAGAGGRIVEIIK